MPDSVKPDSTFDGAGEAGPPEPVTVELLPVGAARAGRDGDGNGGTARTGGLGARFAEDAVAQAVSIAVTDGSTFLRAVGTISATGIAVCMERMIRDKDASYALLASRLQDNMKQAADTFAHIGAQAAGVLKGFSSAG